MSKKDKTIVVRVSEEEYETISGKSNSLGLSISSYVRMLALKEESYAQKIKD